jgi:hypothetical protein
VHLGKITRRAGEGLHQDLHRRTGTTAAIADFDLLTTQIRPGGYPRIGRDDKLKRLWTNREDRAQAGPRPDLVGAATVEEVIRPVRLRDSEIEMKVRPTLRIATGRRHECNDEIGF